MKQVFTIEYYRGARYPEYFTTEHWSNLKRKYIYLNPKAKCWICEITFTLLPHHERYDNLFHERISRDIFILCFNCHTQLHFYKFLFIFNRKTKLSYRNLKRRRLYLRMLFCIHKKRIVRSIWYFLRCIFCF